MPGTDWLHTFLTEMKADIKADINGLKADVKALQRFRWRAEGAKWAVSGLVSLVVTLLAIYFKT